MTKAELGAIISRVFALFYLLKAVWVITINILPLLFYQQTHQTEPFILVLYASLIGFGILALGFWFGAEKLGNLIAGKNHDKKVSVAPAEHFMACVFVGFGCFLFSYIIPDLSELISLVFHDETVQKIKMQNIHMTEKLVKIGLYSVLAIIFILGANGLQRSIIMLRQIGSK